MGLSLSQFFLFPFSFLVVVPPAGDFIESSRHHGFHYKVPSPAWGSFILLCLSLTFLFCLFLPRAILFRHTLHLSAQSSRVHYFSWSRSLTTWEGILSPTNLVDLVLVQLLTQLVVPRIQNYLLQSCGNVFIKNNSVRLFP